MVLRSKPEKREEKDRTRDELLRAALRLGAAHGFASLGLREVAREAQIAPTSFYRHFEDMEALGLAIVRDKLQPFLSEWSAPLAAADPEASALLNALFAAVARETALTRFLLAERHGASAALRGALRESVLLLSHPLYAGVPSSKRTRALLDAAELVGLLLLETAAQLLDGAPEERPGLHARSLARLERALADARNLARSA
jgi:TetR/AcrR family transcriptional regulator, fatty acid biosynthesis regulator